MINNDVLKKWILRNPELGNLDSNISKFNIDILRIKLGFKGIGNRHLSLLPVYNIKRGDKIIWDYHLGSGLRESDIPPRIFQVVSNEFQGDLYTKGILLGFGNGLVLPENQDLIIGKTYLIEYIKYYPLVLKLDSMGRYKTTDNRKCI